MKPEILNETYYELAVPIEVTVNVIDDFIKYTFEIESSSLFSDDPKGYRIDFGYHIDDQQREVGSLIHVNGVETSFIIIKNFARKRFVDYLNCYKIEYIQSR